jgi:hypothetical protein
MAQSVTIPAFFWHSYSDKRNRRSSHAGSTFLVTGCRDTAIREHSFLGLSSKGGR